MVEPVSSDLLAPPTEAGSIPSPRWQAAVGAAVVLVAAGMALGALHGVSCAVVYLLVGFSARAVLQTRPGAAKNVSRVSGAVMIIIALVLLAEQGLH